MEGRYLLFAGETYYPQGGWEDYQRDFATVEEAIKFVDDAHALDKAKEYIDQDGWDWAHIVDRETSRIIRAWWSQTNGWKQANQFAPGEWVIGGPEWSTP